MARLLLPDRTGPRIGNEMMLVVAPGWLSDLFNSWFWHVPYGLRVLLLVFSAAWLALLAHELSHALAARLLGVRIW
ncbi:MAG TPA: hypothetical protein VFD73_22460, partial [Gemmatimonadales bacterium]|nr:hypothetical protein [Gemmatimonadales bacterium]